LAARREAAEPFGTWARVTLNAAHRIWDLDQTFRRHFSSHALAAIDEFASRYPQLKHAIRAQHRCRHVAEKLIDRLEATGVKAELLFMRHPVQAVPTSGTLFAGVPLAQIEHHTVVVEGLSVDFAASQFDENAVP